MFDARLSGYASSFAALWFPANRLSALAEMASGHKDADLPLSTVHRSSSFLADMLQWLQGSGFTAWTVQKEPGNHLCPYWVYCVLDPTCTAKSKVVFGATRYAAVNPNVHAYVRAKQKYLPQAFELLSSFIMTWAAADQPEPEPQHAPPEAPPQQWRQPLNVDRNQCAYTWLREDFWEGLLVRRCLGGW